MKLYIIRVSWNLYHWDYTINGVRTVGFGSRRAAKRSWFGRHK